MKLAGKTVIVTGGGRDIGAAAAKKLSSEGANVAISYFESSKAPIRWFLRSKAPMEKQ